MTFFSDRLLGFHNGIELLEYEHFQPVKLLVKKSFRKVQPIFTLSSVRVLFLAMSLIGQVIMVPSQY